MIIDHAFDGLREISFGLAQGLRAGDFGASLLNGLMGEIHHLLNRHIERLRVLFSHDPGLLAQWGQSLAITDPGIPSSASRELMLCVLVRCVRPEQPLCGVGNEQVPIGIDLALNGVSALFLGHLDPKPRRGLDPLPQQGASCGLKEITARTGHRLSS
jgi:hypothetical protein